MQKYLLFASICVCLISGVLLAQVNPDYYYNALKTAQAPAIDGVMEPEVWANVPEEPVEAIYNDFNDPVLDEYDFSVSFRMTWMDDKLYLYVAVLDDILIADETLDTWQWDNIEVYFDGDNSDGEGAYDGLNDIQLRWTFDEPMRDDGIDIGYGNGADWGFDPEVFEWDILETDSGYNLELAVPYDEFEIAPDLDFGFELQIGDNDPDEDRVFYRWNWNGAGSYMQTINHGTVMLVQEMVPETFVDNRRQDQIVADFELAQNYPNPFNPKTTINYKLAQGSTISLEILNTLGERVLLLKDNKFQPAGAYSVEFNAENLPSGVYLYRLMSENQVLMKKMLLAK